VARAPARPGPGGFAAGGSGARVGRRRRLVAYFQEVWEELRKVIWPKWPELSRMTWVVVATVIVFGLLIGGADYLFAGMASPIISGSGTTQTQPLTPVTTPNPGAAASPSTSPGASPSASASASASPGASPSASASPAASPSATPSP